MPFDLVIHGGTVIDGTGDPGYPADVAVTDDRIVAIGHLAAAQALARVDATGFVVTPGFIDVHTHTDLTAFMSDEHLAVKTAGIRQGVTTEVCGNCGSTPFPDPRASARGTAARDPYLGSLPEGARRQFASLADYRAAVSEQPLVANLAPLVGHGAIRKATVGTANRAPTSDELAAMQRLVAQAMDDGAFGLSSGLIYAPGLFASTEELISLATVVAREGGTYATHMRDEMGGVVQAVEEALRIGRESGASVQISHHKIGGRSNWGLADRTLATIADARAGGTDVLVDVYPYAAASTLLNALLPPWVLDGGREVVLAHLADSASRDRIQHDYSTGLPGWQNLVGETGWDSIILAGEGGAAGQSIAALASDAGQPEVDFVADFLLAQLRTIVIIHMMDPAEVDTILDAPFAVAGSDGVPLPGHQHPRLAGTFARWLNRAAGDLTRLPGVIHRMTGMPAERYGLRGRGVLRPGNLADLVVLDPARIEDGATYEAPLAPPSGLQLVLVAGRAVVRNDELTDARPGQMLARG